MSNRRRPPRRLRPGPASTQRLTPDQLNKIQGQWRCGHCDADPPLEIRACPTCPVLGVYFQHDPSCPVHRGLVSGDANIRRALAT